MKKALQILLTFLTFIAAFYFLFWILGAFLSFPFDSTNPKWIFIVSGILSFLIAAYLAFTVWKKNDKSVKKNPSQGTYILTGALGLGVFGFILGFIGPLIFMPGANQGPLLGILITGPGGIALGAIGGSILWEVKRIKAKKK